MISHEIDGTKRRKIGALLSKSEIEYFRVRSDWRGYWAVFSVWATIIASFVIMALAVDHLPIWSAALVVVAGLMVLGGRHLALAILMHEAAHSSLFKTRWLNDVFTNWLSAKFIWNDVHKFRAHHLVHHANTTASFDPDRPIYEPLPVSRASLSRKFLRDVIGLTGLKFLVGRILMSAGVLKWSDAIADRADTNGWPLHRYLITFVKDFWPTALTNGLLFLALSMSGNAWLYGCWVLAYLIPFIIFVRIRAMAEHGCMEMVPDPLRNTRTTRAGVLARMTVAPICVNYHQEHHIMAATPYYRLPALHKALRKAGHVASPPSYLDVLRIVSTLPEGQIA